MRTMLRGKVTLLFMMLGMLLAVPAIALADNLQDSIEVGAQKKTIGTGNGNTWTNKYWVQATGSGTSGCDIVTTSEAVTFKLNVPAGVTATSPDGTNPDGSPKLVFDACGTSTTNTKSVTFSSNTPGIYNISATYVSGGGSDGDTFNENPANLELTVVNAPTVTAISPADNATGVALNADVTATFSEAMDATAADGDPSTITTSTFTLVKDGDATNTPISAAVTYDSATNTAKLDPSSNLLPNTKYNATVVSGDNGVRTSTNNVTLAQNKTWSFTTLNPNAAPVANNDSYTVNEGGTLNVPAPGVLGNDNDADNNPLTATLVGTGPSHDSNFSFNSDGSFVYTHDGSETTSDSFTYKANDGTVDSNTVTVTITIVPVDDPPTAVDDSATVQEDANATAINVLGNDNDADSGPKTIESVTQPDNGTVAITGGGSGLTYEPDADYCNDPPATNLDTFTYTLNGDSTATVSVTVTCVNDAPTTPGAITSTESLNNDGTFKLDWGASTDVDSANITYTLEHRDFAATSDWEEVDSGLNSPSYTFGGSNPAELEGLWDYRVKAVDDYSPPASSDFREALNLVKVDQTNPNAPTLSFATGAGQSQKATVDGVDWYKDSALINVSANGDPVNARDGSPGSGVDAASFPASFSVTTNGESTTSKTVKDNATNESAASDELTVHVDAANPTFDNNCPGPASFLVNSGSGTPTTQSVTIGASDNESGIDSANSQLTKSVDTSSTGTKTVTFTAKDKVGHSVTKNCSYEVNAHTFIGFSSPVDNPSYLNVMKAGQAVPLKWQLKDASGNPVTNLQSVTVKVTDMNCSLGQTADQVEEFAAGSSSLQNLGGGYYQFNWKSPTSYAKSCKTLTVNGVGVQQSALFNFTK